MFEKATRCKLRFTTPKGQVTVEDLWDLPLTSATGKANLDDIARELDGEVKKSPHISFVNPSESAGDALTKLKFDIVLHIIKQRVAEAASVRDAKARAEKKQQLLEIINQKQNAELVNMPLDELQKMVKEFD